MKKTVIFDLGNVLLRWDPRAILRRFSDDEQERRAYAQVLSGQCWQALDAGLIEYDKALKFYAGLLQKPQSEIERLMQTMRESLAPLPLGVALLRDLHQQGVDLICISNMPLHAIRYLRHRYDYWPLFRGMVISAEVQFIKPDPAIFRYALETYGLNPAQTLFIDDMQVNIDAAAALGIAGVCYQNRPQDVEQVYRFIES
ncbi:HAD family phosphatase [Uruburuella testudinis]|uniref:HAD family phosphatase n=1 Tax=Uruburuella testudinis TaxID=1282863 RepID=A0ABY4DV09_9NEIS|nr:HAD family phosphatase [Uruburuella testudinis]UOO81849.1 HAD family phosphatase [Uruburuella testudinis]